MNLPQFFIFLAQVHVQTKNWRTGKSYLTYSGTIKIFDRERNLSAVVSGQKKTEKNLSEETNIYIKNKPSKYLNTLL